jgi:hypothetical protein
MKDTMNKGFPAKCGRLTISQMENMLLALGKAVEWVEMSGLLKVRGKVNP